MRYALVITCTCHFHICTCIFHTNAGGEFLSGDLAHELGAAEGSVAVVSDPDGYAVRLIAKGAILKE